MANRQKSKTEQLDAEIRQLLFKMRKLPRLSEEDRVERLDRAAGHLSALEFTSLDGFCFPDVVNSLPKALGLDIPAEIRAAKLRQARQQSRWNLWQTGLKRYRNKIERKEKFQRKLRAPPPPDIFLSSAEERINFVLAFALQEVYGCVEAETIEEAEVPWSVTIEPTNMSIPINGRRPRVRDEDMPRDDVKATWYLMKLNLIITTSLFTCRTMLTERCFDKSMGKVKELLKKSQQEHETRFWLGTALDLWTDLTECFETALPQLRAQADYMRMPLRFECWSDFLISHSTPLLKDLERLNDCLLLARNMLASTTIAQNYAAEAKFDKQVLLLLEFCTQVTARGYDGEPGHRDEPIFTAITNSFKVLLVTCLQFLHNLIMQNENRKLHLWLDLFCVPSDPPLSSTLQAPDLPSGGDESSATRSELYNTMPREEDITRGVSTLFGPFENTEKLVETQVSEKARFGRLMKLFASGSGLNESASRMPDSEGEAINEDETSRGEDASSIGATQGSTKSPIMLPDLMQFCGLANVRDKDGGGEYPLGIENLPALYLSAKKDLVRPLGLNFEEVSHSDDDDDDDDEPREPEDEEGEPEDEEEYSDDEEQNARDAYDAAVRKPRGILTDIPLVLGPTEIEALPMILQACIFSTKDPADMTKPQRLMQALRCNLLLNQESGMALLRELLIFIAAWDLPEKELYFKLMANIISAIMSYNLLPLAYRAFDEEKEPVSPAQSILLKLVLYNLRRKLSAGPPSIPSSTHNLSNVPEDLKPDIDTIIFLVRIFRETVMPTTVALIWLQGQVREGTAVNASNFTENLNINLWDMERLYEGVYLFLDFFSAVNEMQLWKSLLVVNSVEYDIIVLLRTLDDNIPKERFEATAPTADARQGTHSDVAAADSGSASTSNFGSVAVEHPYSLEAPQLTSPTSPPLSPSQSDPDAPHAPQAFPWRNLKKMCMLVLSGLLYRTPPLRAEIRSHGGVELILGCCTHDGYNPYIKEHALVCLKLLMDGDAENQRIVRELEAREVVDDSAESLAKMGLEAKIKDGKVSVGQRQQVEEVEEVEESEGNYHHGGNEGVWVDL